MGITFLMTLLFIVMAGLIYTAKGIYTQNTASTARKGFKKWTGFSIIIVIIIVIGFLLVVLFLKPTETSRWEGLSKEEKEWYKDNYGDGQYDAIQDAIDNYND